MWAENHGQPPGSPYRHMVPGEARNPREKAAGILPFHTLAVEITVFLSVDGTLFLHTNHQSKPLCLLWQFLEILRT